MSEYTSSQEDDDFDAFYLDNVFDAYRACIFIKTAVNFG